MDIIDHVDVDAAPLTSSEVFPLRQAKAADVVAIAHPIPIGVRSVVARAQVAAIGHTIPIPIRRVVMARALVAAIGNAIAVRLHSDLVRLLSLIGPFPVRRQVLEVEDGALPYVGRRMVGSLAARSDRWVEGTHAVGHALFALLLHALLVAEIRLLDGTVVANSQRCHRTVHHLLGQVGVGHGATLHGKVVSDGHHIHVSGPMMVVLLPTVAVVHGLLDWEATILLMLRLRLMLINDRLGLDCFVVGGGEGAELL